MKSWVGRGVRNEREGVLIAPGAIVAIDNASTRIRNLQLTCVICHRLELLKEQLPCRERRYKMVWELVRNWYVTLYCQQLKSVNEAMLKLPNVQFYYWSKVCGSYKVGN